MLSFKMWLLKALHPFSFDVAKASEDVYMNCEVVFMSSFKYS